MPRIAAVVDVRGRSFFADLRSRLEATRGQRRHARASSSSRPPTTRSSAGSSRSAARTRCRATGGSPTASPPSARCSRDLRGDADLVIDTSALNVHELRAAGRGRVRRDGRPQPAGHVISFGYKYGLPVDADLVLDCRFLPNPHWVPELRPQTGLDAEVSDYVLAQPGAERAPRPLQRPAGLIAAGYLREGKRFVTLAVGCTGGKHRSVAMAEELAAAAPARTGDRARVVHRDLGRE